MIYYSGHYYGYEYLLLVGASFAIISGYFDALDGKIARLSGKISSKGDYIDHVFDRYSDIFMFGSVAFSIRWCNPYIGMMAIIGILLTSYIGTQAQAVGINRIYSGLLGRADRIIILTTSMVLQFMMLHFGYSSFKIFGFNTCWMEIMMLWFVIAGNITAVQRAIMIWAALNH